MSTDLYFSKLENDYKTYVENIFNEDNNIFRLPSYYMKELEEQTKGMKRCDRERHIKQFFLNKVDQCDAFLYTNTYTKDGNVLFEKGVRDEIARAIKLEKDIYRLYLDNFKPVKLQKFDDGYIKNVVESYNYSKENWVLKTVEDYIRFYENNPEVLDLIKRQFGSDIGTCIAIPHRNFVYYIDEMNKKGWGKGEKIGSEATMHKPTGCIAGCKYHDNKKHAVILPKQELTKECPFLSNTWIWAEYRTNSLNPLPENNIELMNLLSSARTLHKLMYIIRRDVDCSNTGIAYVDDSGKMPFVRGSPIKDYTKIVGVRPIFDIDIKDEIKKVDSFFDPEIFAEYQKTLDLFLSSYEDDGIIRTVFSGNGLYIDLGEHLFTDFSDNNFDCLSFSDFDMEWKNIRKIMQQLMEDNGITKLQIEKGYGWNRYFKISATFHAKSERISLPLNIEEPLDYKWIKEMSDINLGLGQNIFKEIIRKAGNRWT